MIQQFDQFPLLALKGDVSGKRARLHIIGGDYKPGEGRADVPLREPPFSCDRRALESGSGHPT
ncbi:MAG: hypothetical protein IPO91_03410 [Chloroflexi bacterium]|nr:hypothetical protein [Chloroflexota bacterium]